MKKCIVDIETLSPVSLKKHGVDRYAVDKNTHVTIICVKEEGGELKTWINKELFGFDLGQNEEALEIIKNADKLVAHNAYFEYAVMKEKFSKLRKWDLNDFVDTMIWSNIFRGPASLEHACRYWKTPIQKDAIGGKILSSVYTAKLEEPKTKSFTTMAFKGEWQTNGKIWYKASREIYTRLAKYCSLDVEATEALLKRLRKEQYILPKDLRKITSKGIEMNNIMNANGLHIDMDLIAKIMQHKEDSQALLKAKTNEVLGCNPTQHKVLKETLNERGFKVNGVGKKVLEAALKREDLKEHELAPFIEYFLKMNKTAFNKATKVMDTNIDGQVYGFLRFSGAPTTGRWSAKNVQFQNMASPKDTMEETLRILNEEKVSDKNMEIMVGGVRAMIVPKKGKKFFVGDLKQIEPRLGFYRIGRMDVLEQMYEGWCPYTDLAQDAFQKEIEKGSRERQAGKVGILQLMYGAGDESFFESMTIGWGIDIGYTESLNLRTTYHEKYPEMMATWDEMMSLFIKDVKTNKCKHDLKLTNGRILKYPDVQYKLNPHAKKVVKNALGEEKWISLRPSWHYKHYGEFVPKDAKGEPIRGKGKDCLRRNIYGSLLFQHQIQSEARDIMLAKAVAMYLMGYDIKLTVHDEIVIEVDEDMPLEKMEKDWKNAGKEYIEKYWPGLQVPSDCVCLPRYWSH